MPRPKKNVTIKEVPIPAPVVQPKVNTHIKRYVAVVVNPRGALLYHGPSETGYKQQGLLRKNQSVRVLAECEGFGQLSAEPPRWIKLSDVEPYNKPFARP